MNLKGNTRSVDRTVLKKQWEFPQTNETGRIFTKHYVNLVFTLKWSHLSLLSFLIYQSDNDNSFRYSTKLLHQYKRAVDLAQERYGKKEIGRSWAHVQKYFKALIENGLILKAGDKYLINPNLTFHKEVKPKFYKEWLKEGNAEKWINKLIER